MDNDKQAENMLDRACYTAFYSCGVLCAKMSRKDKSREAGMPADAERARTVHQQPQGNHKEKQAYTDASFDIACKQLSQDNISPDAKLQIIINLFQRFPTKAPYFLASVIKDADKPTSEKLIELLCGLESPALLALYRAFLESDDSVLVMQGVMGLNRLGSEAAMAAMISAAGNPNPGVRRMIANCIDWRGGNAGTNALIRLKNDSDESVARIAIRKLGNKKNRFALISLMSKLSSPSVKIRKEAAEALHHMTGGVWDNTILHPRKKGVDPSKVAGSIGSLNQASPIEAGRQGIEQAGVGGGGDSPGCPPSESGRKEADRQLPRLAGRQHRNKHDHQAQNDSDESAAKIATHKLEDSSNRLVS